MALFKSELFRGPEGRFAYTKGLFKAEANKRGYKQFLVTILFSKQADLKVMQDVAIATAEGAWPGKGADGIKSGLVKNPFLDGDGKQGLSQKTGERKEGFAGTWFIRATSGEEFKPAVFDGSLLPILDVSGFQSGWYGFPVLNCFAWQNDEQGKGLTFGINMVQMSRRGENIGGGGGAADPDQFFDKIADTGAVDDKVRSSGQGAGSLFS